MADAESKASDKPTVKASLLARRDQLVAEQDAYIAQVNNSLGQYKGRIAQIDEMLAMLDTPPDAAKNGDKQA